MPFWFSADDFISVQILFEGRKGSGFQGDIAIDDIMFFRQPCEGFPIASTCTFEQGLDFCGFRIERTAENKGWKWYDAYATETPPIPTGRLVGWLVGWLVGCSGGGTGWARWASGPPTF